jgi:hypothetical protein
MTMSAAQSTTNTPTQGAASVGHTAPSPAPKPSQARQPGQPRTLAAQKTSAAAKPAAKTSAKTPSKSARKAAPAGAANAVRGKAAPQTATHTTPAAAPAATKAAPKTTSKKKAPASSKPAKDKKVKVVRDSFTLPKTELLQIDAMKKRAMALGVEVKKSELIRAGLQALVGMADAAFKKAMAMVPTIKTGRPAKD